MTQYEDIFAQVVGFTNKPKLVSETNIAIQQAVRKCHKAGKFWRDLVSVPVTADVAELQTVDLSMWPDFRQIAVLQSPLQDKPLDPIGILDQNDYDGFFKKDVCFAIGTQLNIRAATPSGTYTMVYWKLPIIGDITTLSTWIYANHMDAIVCDAAATVLAMIGEQEVKTRVERLAAIAMQDLVSDNLEIIGR